MYQIHTENGYIISVVKGTTQSNMTESEYESFRAALERRPVPPEGFGCRLKTDLTWEMYELPPATEEDE